MNLQTAEIYLPCYRAGRRMDARIAKAARVAEGDDALRGKLAAQTDFDERMVEAIHTIKAPEGLRERLEACSAASLALRKHARHPAILCAIVGTLLIIGFLVYLELDRRATFPGKDNVVSMIDLLEKMSGLELEPAKGPVSGLADWFYIRGFDAMELPPELGALPAVGARTFKQSGHPVGQLAIDRHASILTVFRASDFNVRLDPEGDWTFFERDEWSAAIRQREDICTLFALRGSRAEMEEVVRSLTQ
jgi:hypothetical protein